MQTVKLQTASRNYACLHFYFNFIFSQMGQFKTGMVVPKMGVVSMGGGSYVAKASTTNPPLWCWTDNAGNRFTFSDGGYCLTGEVNTAEYDVWAEKGDTGEKGDKGDDGEKGDKGDKGEMVKRGTKEIREIRAYKEYRAVSYGIPNGQPG